MIPPCWQSYFCTFSPSQKGLKVRFRVRVSFPDPLDQKATVLADKIVPALQSCSNPQQMRK